MKGNVGDCWLLAALASVACHEQIIAQACFRCINTLCARYRARDVLDKSDLCVYEKQWKDFASFR